MHSSSDVLALLREIEWPHVLLMAVVLAGARALSAGITWLFVGLERRAPSPWRMTLMRFMPLTRFLVAVGAVILIIPLVIQPSASSVLTLLVSVGLALAFTLKDYASSVVAALVTVFEHPYQPGDWITVDKTYGEVKAIGLRCRPCGDAGRHGGPHPAQQALEHESIQRDERESARSVRRGLLPQSEPRWRPSATDASPSRVREPVPSTREQGDGDRCRKALGHALQAEGLCERQSRSVRVRHRPDAARKRGASAHRCGASTGPICGGAVTRGHRRLFTQSSASHPVAPCALPKIYPRNWGGGGCPASPRCGSAGAALGPIAASTNRGDYTPRKGRRRQRRSGRVPRPLGT